MPVRSATSLMARPFTFPSTRRSTLVCALLPVRRPPHLGSNPSARGARTWRDDLPSARPRSHPPDRRLRLCRLPPARRAARPRPPRARARPRRPTTADLPPAVAAPSGRRRQGRGPHRGARGRPHRLLPDPLDGPRREPERRLRQARPRGRRQLRRGGERRRRRARRLPRRARPDRPRRLAAPALAPRGRGAAGPARARARLRARGDGDRPGQRLVRDAAPPRQAAPGDDHAALGRHALPARRDRRRGADAGRRRGARRGAGRGPGRRRRGPHLP